MTNRSGLARAAGVVGISVAALAGTLAFGGGTASADTGYRPLEAGDLPASSTPWTAGALTAGAGDPLFCLEDVVSDRGTVRRDFRTELDTSATQLIIERNSAAAARRTVNSLRAAIEDCADGFERQHPDNTADWVDYGGVAAGDGGHVYGIDSSHEGYTQDVHLFGVGREGDVVTVVVWGQLGRLDSAPVEEFRDTTGTAVERLG